MEVKFREIVEKRAHLGNRESIRVAIEVIRRECDLPETCYYSETDKGADGEVCNTIRRVHEYGGGSHSWDEHKYYRDAMPFDLAALNTISKLQEADKNYSDNGEYY